MRISNTASLRGSFPHLDGITMQKEDEAFILEHKGITRALKQPTVLQRRREGLSHPDLTRAATYYRTRRISNQKLLSLEWNLFRLTFFAPWVDYAILQRLSLIRPYIGSLFVRSMLSLLLRVAERRYARWLYLRYTVVVGKSSGTPQREQVGVVEIFHIEALYTSIYASQKMNPARSSVQRLWQTVCESQLLRQTIIHSKFSVMFSVCCTT